jgi:sucrose-6-phosphate hydrolase SacC (GH32 family)
MFRVNECTCLLFNTTEQFFSATFEYHGTCIYICKKLHFNEMMMVISWIFKLLARWNNSLQVHMSLYSDKSSWFQANQCCYLNHYFNYTSSIHISGIIVSLPALSAIDCGFDFWLGQTKNYKTSIYCFLDN